jgi:hypothetical protein
VKIEEKILEFNNLKDFFDFLIKRRDDLSKQVEENRFTNSFDAQILSTRLSEVHNLILQIEHNEHRLDNFNGLLKFSKILSELESNKIITRSISDIIMDKVKKELQICTTSDF